MKLIKTLSLLLVCSLILSSCSKEKQLKRQLKREDSWNIETLEWVKTTQAVQGEDGSLIELGITSGVISDAGTIEFDKDDKGSYDFQLDNGIQRDQKFTWVVQDENTVSISDNQTNILGGLFDLVVQSINEEDPEFNFRTEAFAYELTPDSGDKFKIEGGGGIQAFSLDSDLLVEQYTYTINMIISKD